jgi:alpha-ketoglutarate-dependent taurine dioxygenase
MNLTVSPLDGPFGAEVHGFDAGSMLDANDHAVLRSAFDEFGVVVLREVELERPAQTLITELVSGEDDLDDEKIAADASRQSTFYISNRIEDAAAPFGRLMWHSDGMWSGHPFHVISLYGEEVEPPVPPTRFASAVRAWDTLPATLRERVQGRFAVHVPGPEGFAHRRGDDGGDLVQPMRDKAYSATEPIGFSHPRTTKTILFVSQQMTSHIDDVTQADSEDLLEALFAHMYSPENVIEHQWSQGDLVVWDNLACQHARPDVALESSVRTLRKIGWPLPPMAKEQLVGSYKRIAAKA